MGINVDTKVQVVKSGFTVETNNLSYTAKAPGSLMLFGEHAVLRGKLALACAVDSFVTVKITPCAGLNEIQLESTNQNLGAISIRIEHLKVDLARLYPKWSFVLTSLGLYRKQISHGFRLKVIADAKGPIGLGSSAAVTVATLAALESWLNREHVETKTFKINMLKNAIKVIREVQGVGSGADAAASIIGGVIAYRSIPLEVERIGDVLPLQVVYSGKKVATKEIVTEVAARETRHKKLFANIFTAMDECAKEAKHAVLVNDLRALGELMNIHQGLQDALGVNTEILSKIIFGLRASPGMLGAKISGSGMGDCVIGLFHSIS